MNHFFGVIGVGCLLASVTTCASSQSAVHEIEALLLFLIAVVCFLGAHLITMLQSRKGGP